MVNKKAGIPFPKKAVIIGGNKKAIVKGLNIAEGVCLARDLENRPGNIATPEHLADNAKSIGRSGDMKVTIIEREK